MATLYSDIGKLQNDANPKSLTTPLQTAAQIRMFNPLYTTTGAEAAADIINLVSVPVGIEVVPYLSQSYTIGALATTAATMAIGDDGGGSNPGAVAALSTRYSAAVDLKGVGAHTFSGGGAAAGVPFVTTAQTWIQATYTVSTTPLVGGTIRFYIVAKVAR